MEGKKVALGRGLELEWAIGVRRGHVLRILDREVRYLWLFGAGTHVGQGVAAERVERR